MSLRLAASFRDPSGWLYRAGDGTLLRQVNQVYRADYDRLMSSGLYDRLVEQGLLIPHREVAAEPLDGERCYKVLQPELVPFISYPYEWCFSQLQDAALATLAIQKAAMARGMTLKDASAYNIQFVAGRPVLIDTLSFAAYTQGTPWVAYRQFCQHFLAPLALMARRDVRLGKLMSGCIDGIPLDLASRLLPGSTRLNFGLLSHIHLHAKAEARYSATAPGETAGEGRQAAPRMSQAGLLGLIDSLEGAVRSLRLPITGREWADYYTDTNYTPEALSAKRALVAERAARVAAGKRVLDLGANTGLFSRAAAEAGAALVLSTDIDPEAVEQNYRQLKAEPCAPVLPLVVDLTNPPPAIGWDNAERSSFYARAESELVLALALVHHLAIGNNVPLGDLGATLARLGRWVLLEFVPKTDLQVQRLLRSRDDIFPDYHLEGLVAALDPVLALEEQVPVPGSQRTLLLFRRR